VAAWVASVAFFALFQIPAALTLEEALAIAEQNAFGIRIAESQVDRARHRVSEARGALGPRVTADATYTRFDREGVAEFGGMRFVTQPIDTKQARISVTMPVDIAGTIRSGVRAAEAGLAAQQALLDAERNDLRFQVRQTYFQLLQAHAQTEVARQALQRARERQANAEQLLRAGAVARVDVLRFQSQVAQAEADFIAAENSARLVQNALNNVLGRPIETPIQPQDVPALPEVDAAAPWIEAARANRPELLAARYQIQTLENIRAGERRGLAPSLGLSAVHTRNFGAGGFSAQTQQTVGTVALTVPVFDSGVTTARIRQADEDVRQAQIRLEQADLGVSLEVRQALTNLQNARSRLAVAETQVRLAEETYRIAQVRYEAGEAIQLEVNEAQTELTRAQTLFVSARYEFLRSWAELLRATGEGTAQPTGEQAGDPPMGEDR
jgi:outer membrane protein